jgi:cytochrome P450
MTRCPARYDDELGMWIVDDPDQVREVLLDPGTFRPDNAVVAHTPLSVKALRVLSSVGFALPPTLANNAGPSHRPIRQAVARFFSPARVAAVEPLTRRLFTERVAAAAAQLETDGTADLVDLVAGTTRIAGAGPAPPPRGRRTGVEAVESGFAGVVLGLAG